VSYEDSLPSSFLLEGGKSAPFCRLIVPTVSPEIVHNRPRLHDLCGLFQTPPDYLCKSTSVSVLTPHTFHRAPDEIAVSILPISSDICTSFYLINPFSLLTTAQSQFLVPEP
jgi:hypothetical protein